MNRIRCPPQLRRFSQTFDVGAVCVSSTRGEQVLRPILLCALSPAVAAACASLAPGFDDPPKVTRKFDELTISVRFVPPLCAGVRSWSTTTRLERIVGAPRRAHARGALRSSARWTGASKALRLRRGSSGEVAVSPIGALACVWCRVDSSACLVVGSVFACLPCTWRSIQPTDLMAVVGCVRRNVCMLQSKVCMTCVMLLCVRFSGASRRVCALQCCH